MKLAAIFSLVIMAAGTLMAKDAPLPTVKSVDLKRYQGRWYNIAREPAWFQNECERSTATYTVRANGTVGVWNECVTHEGKTKRITGTATAVDGSNSKLVVKFDNFAGKVGLAKGDYWILYLDPGYQTVVVGTPNRKYLWILAREPKLPPGRYAALVKVAQSLGFDTSRLIRDKW